MNTHDILLRAILEDPADDFHRLAFADHLEEEGRSEHATYLRLCLRCSSHGHECKNGVPPERCACCLLAAEETELGNQGKLRTPLSFIDQQWSVNKSRFQSLTLRFHRGFVNEVKVNVGDFPHLHTLFQVFPIIRFRFADRMPLPTNNGGPVNAPDSRFVGVNGKVCWYRGVIDHFGASEARVACDVIPRSLFLALKPDCHHLCERLLQWGIAIYDDVASAEADLSRACVRLMRRQVGLPEIPI